MMKNNKGQMMVGGLIMIAIAAIVGVILLVGSAQNVGEATNTVSVVNLTIAVPANGGVYNFTDYRAVSSGFVAINGTGGETIGSGNYTIADNQVVDGDLAATLTVDDAEYQSINWNVSFTGQPTGYIDNAGGRAIAKIIIIFFALSIAVVTLVPTLRSKILGSIK